MPVKQEEVKFVCVGGLVPVASRRRQRWGLMPCTERDEPRNTYFAIFSRDSVIANRCTQLREELSLAER